MKKFLKVKQVRSTIGVTEAFRLNLKGLGLGRPGREVVVANTPSFRGAIKKVLHLVTVEEVDTSTCERSERGAGKNG
jgi:large subunit ribosomal protein L30